MGRAFGVLPVFEVPRSGKRDALENLGHHAVYPHCGHEADHAPEDEAHVSRLLEPEEHECDGYLGQSHAHCPEHFGDDCELERQLELLERQGGCVSAAEIMLHRLK